MIPRALRVVALIQLVGGLFAAAGFVFQLTQGRLILDFGVLGVPICFGLLRLSNGWRTCAIVLLQIGLILLPCVFVLGLAAQTPGRLQICGVEVARVSPLWLAVLAVPLFILTWWQYRVLTRPEIRSLFLHPAEGQAG